MDVVFKNISYNSEKYLDKLFYDEIMDGVL